MWLPANHPCYCCLRQVGCPELGWKVPAEHSMQLLEPGWSAKEPGGPAREGRGTVCVSTQGVGGSGGCTYMRGRMKSRVTLWQSQVDREDTRSCLWLVDACLGHNPGRGGETARVAVSGEQGGARRTQQADLAHIATINYCSVASNGAWLALVLVVCVTKSPHRAPAGDGKKA